MPNMIGQNDARQASQNYDSGAEITEEMQRRLMLGEKGESDQEEEPLEREDTVAGRAAAAPRSPGKS